MEHQFSIEESLRFGWQKTRANSTLVFQVLVTLFGVQIAQQVVTRVLHGTLEGFVASAALALLGIVLGIGLTAIILKIAKGQHASYQDIVQPARVSIAYIAANLISAIIILVPVLIGLVVSLIAYALLPASAALGVTAIIAALAAVASVYFMLRYAFVRFSILENTDIVESLRTSARLTKGHKWQLLGFIIVIALLNLVGIMLLLVGLLVTVPVTMFAYAHIYAKLHAHHSSHT